MKLSTHQIRRAYPPHTCKPTLVSRAEFFHRYVQKSLLDLPPSRNLSFRYPLPHFTIHSWNLETLIGLSKYEMLSDTLQKFSVKLLCMQETKSAISNEITEGAYRYLLSGTPEEPYAGVGFAVHCSLLPFVHDFHPFSGRIAILILNTKPRKIAFFSIYAPSQLADSDADFQRKHVFWDDLTDIVQEYSRSHQILLLGDWNTRLYSNHVSSMPDFVGPVIFKPPPELMMKLLCTLTCIICMISSQPQIHV